MSHHRYSTRFDYRPEHIAGHLCELFDLNMYPTQCVS
jgi:hypothetical protein